MTRNVTSSLSDPERLPPARPEYTAEEKQRDDRGRVMRRTTLAVVETHLTAASDDRRRSLRS